MKNDHNGRSLREISAYARQNPDVEDKDDRGPVNGVSAVLGVAWTIKVWIGAVTTNFIVTLAVFPAITSLIKSVSAGSVSPH